MRLADKHHIVQRGEVVWSGSSAALAADRDALSNYLGV